MSFIGHNSQFGKDRGYGRGTGAFFPPPSSSAPFQTSSSFSIFKSPGFAFTSTSPTKPREAPPETKRAGDFGAFSLQLSPHSGPRAAEASQGDLRGAKVSMRMARGGGGRGGALRGGRKSPFEKKGWVAEEEDGAVQHFRGRNPSFNRDGILENPQKGASRRERPDSGLGSFDHGGSRYRQEESSAFAPRQPRGLASPPRPHPDQMSDSSTFSIDAEKRSTFPSAGALAKAVSVSPFMPLPPTTSSLVDGALKDGRPPIPLQSPRAVIALESSASFSMAARLFDVFVEKLACADESKREEARIELESAFLGDAALLGIHGGNFSRTASELMIVWKRRKENQKTAGTLDDVPGEVWVALYALGCQLNLILSIVRATDEATAGDNQEGMLSGPGTLSLDLDFGKSIQANLVLALTDACTYANQLSDLLLLVYQQQSKLRTPYAILPIVLERVRSVFEEAALQQQHRSEDKGGQRCDTAESLGDSLSSPLGSVQSNMEMNLLKLFSIFQRKVAQVTKDAPEPRNSSGGDCSGSVPNSSKILQYQSEADRQLVLSFAHIVYELLPTKVLPDNFLRLLYSFMEAFHRSFPECRHERCILYYSHSTRLLQNALDVPTLEMAAQLLAQAIVMAPPEAPANNSSLLELKLIAVQLALGNALKTPPLEGTDASDGGMGVPPALADAVVAVKTANLKLLDETIRNNGVFYIETGIYNIMKVVRERVAFLMAIKFYLHECKRSRALPEADVSRVDRLEVADMVNFYDLPYSTVTEAIAMWLLPLLLNRKINGYVEAECLYINPENPFDGYDKSLFEAALETYEDDKNVIM